MSTVRAITKNLGEKKNEKGEVIVKGATATVNYTIGDNLEENVKLFGAEVVNSGFVSGLVIDVQAVIGSALKKGLSAEECQRVVDSWKPGVGGGRGAVIVTETAMVNAFAKMSPEEQKAHLAKLQAQLAAKK